MLQQVPMRESPSRRTKGDNSVPAPTETSGATETLVGSGMRTPRRRSAVIVRSRKMRCASLHARAESTRRRSSSSVKTGSGINLRATSSAERALRLPSARPSAAITTGVPPSLRQSAWGRLRAESTRRLRALALKQGSPAGTTRTGPRIDASRLRGSDSSARGAPLPTQTTRRGAVARSASRVRCHTGFPKRFADKNLFCRIGQRVTVVMPASCLRHVCAARNCSARTLVLRNRVSRARAHFIPSWRSTGSG